MTRLTKLKIAGYKSISLNHPVEMNVKDITILLGANGSGKSNIVSFLRMLNYMMSGTLQSYVEEHGASQLFLHYGSSVTQNITGEFEFESDTVKNKYEFTLSYATPDKLILTSEITTVDDHQGHMPSVMRHDVNYRESILVEPTDNKVLRVIHNMLAMCKVYQFHDSSSRAGMRNSSSVDFNDYLQSEANNLAAFLLRLKQDFRSDYDNIVRHVRFVVPQFKDFVLEPKGNRVMLRWRDDSASDYIFAPDQFSDGSIRFIALATLLLQPAQTMPRVVIIDEPELGLHPVAIQQLAEMMRQAANFAQVIISSQSAALVDEFEVEDVAVVESRKESGRHYTTVHRCDATQLAEWVNEYSVGELWDKNILGGRPI